MIDLDYLLDFLIPKSDGENIHRYTTKSIATDSKIHHRILKNEQFVQECFFGFEYEQEDIKNLIHRSKFNGEFAIAREMSELLLIKFKQTGLNIENFLVTFVPPDPQRFIERGYHIPHQIATSFSTKLGLSCREVFVKTKSTPSQTQLDAESRITNLNQTFIVKKGSLTDIQHLLIIDDVTTTGATLLECKRAIQEYNPEITTIALTFAG